MCLGVTGAGGGEAARLALLTVGDVVVVTVGDVGTKCKGSFEAFERR